MAYQSGTATNLQDLLNKIGTFASANGWTVHFSGARTGGAGSNGHALILSRGVVQAWIGSDNSAGSDSNPGPFLGALLWSGTYNSASTESQPNFSPTNVASSSNWFPGPFVSYHAFCASSGASIPYLHVTVEVTAQTYRHFGVGQLRRMGAYTSGAYCYNTMHDFGNSFINLVSTQHGWPFNAGGAWRNTIVRADFGAVSPRYCRIDGSANEVGRLMSSFYSFDFGTLGALPWSRKSAFTGRAPLLPLLCFVQADTTDQLLHPIGWPEDMRYINVENFTPGDTVTLGSDTWRVFPVIRKGSALAGPPGVQNSWYMGYAFRQNG